MSLVESGSIILGTRGSELARVQAQTAATALRSAWPDLEITTRIISTRGDERTAEPVDKQAGRKGLFTREIERALSEGTIDVAVHSAKDLPSEALSALEIGSALARAPVADVLITKNETALADRGVIGTGSVRRQHQLRRKYPAMQTMDLRGNVPTRLRKFVESDWTAIVLAGAGLGRLGYDAGSGSFDFEGTRLHARLLDVEEFLPAGGQGIIALQIRSADAATKRILLPVNDPNSFACLETEREFLRLLQGDCDSPVGVLATIEDGRMTVRAQVFEPPRIEPRAGRVEGRPDAGKELARELWEAVNG